MTMQLKVENMDRTRVLMVTAYDVAGDPPAPVAAEPIGILPRQAGYFTVHDLRSLHVAEGDQVRALEAAPVAELEPVADALGDAPGDQVPGAGGE